MHVMTTKFSPQRIASFCTGAGQQTEVRAVTETGSTNADLLAALDSLSRPTLLVAEKQTAGRGRAGRVWHSAPGASLTFSLAWRFRLPVQALVGLPLAAGVAIAEALAEFDVPAQLKWPNDVLVDRKKLAGILIETAAAAGPPDAISWAVTGIGINMAIPEDMAVQIGRPVASVSRLAQLDQDRLMATLVNHLAQAMAQFEQDGLQGFTQRWNDLHAYGGQQVIILDNDRVLHEGRAAGIDGIGRFVLETAAGPVAVMAGDVSLRALENSLEDSRKD
jgi:BirA family biotin operon repressor/biotin-[acetyl-CoA-carboxylase] ligase